MMAPIILDRRSVLGGLLASLLATTAQAQTGVRSGGSGRLDGARRNGNVWEFTTPTGAVAPTRLGIYTAGMQEPLSPDESGAAWLFVTGTADLTIVELKVNVAGNPLIFGTVEYILR